MLKGCWDADSRLERPDQGRWVAAVKAYGYVQACMNALPGHIVAKPLAL